MADLGEAFNITFINKKSFQNLDYFLSAITYFDFFSLDNFKIFNGSKNIAKSYNVEFVTIEILLISFINYYFSAFLRCNLHNAF
jgi:hypothetical protein